MGIYKIKNDGFLKVKRSAAGLGLFADKDIARGTLVTEYTGDLITTEQADKRGGKYLFKINSKWVVDGKGRQNLARYINHCCKPNCEVIIDRKMILIYALRDIPMGEELNYDYGKEYFLTFIKPHGCLCPYCKAKSLLKN